MQAQILTPSAQLHHSPMFIGSPGSGKLTCAIIASIIFASVIVTSSLILSSVITLTMPPVILIIALVISSLAILRLICLFQKNCQKKLNDFPPNLSLEEREMIKKAIESFPAYKFQPNDILNDDEQMVIYAWSAHFFVKMNAYAVGKEKKKEIRHINQIAIQALAKLPPAENQAHLFRGADFTPSVLTKLYQVGKIHKLDRFMSTTRDSVESFSRDTKFFITGKSGKDIHNYSSCAHEKEVIFSPGTLFLVTDINLNITPKRVHMQEL